MRARRMAAEAQDPVTAGRRDRRFGPLGAPAIGRAVHPSVAGRWRIGRTGGALLVGDRAERANPAMMADQAIIRWRPQKVIADDCDRVMS